MSETRKLEFEIEIGATPKEIWQALTEADGITRWFAPMARVEPGVGGSVFVSWGGGMEGTAPIHLWEPDRRFGWTEGAKLVECEIEAAAGGTVRLRLVQSGFGADAKFDAELESTRGGWLIYLAMLKHAAENYPGVPARQVHISSPLPGALAEEWPKLVGLGSIVEGAPYLARIGAMELPGRVIRYPKPGYLCVAAPNAVVAYFVERMGESSMRTIQCVLFGERVAEAEAVQAELAAIGV